MKDSFKFKTYDQRLAYLIVKPLKGLPVHPNHFTLLTLLLGQTSAWLFALAMQEYAWLAALLYMLAIFSDHLDGELARLTGKTSLFGHNFDFLVGGINYTALFIGIGIGLHFHWSILLGISAGLCNPVITYFRMSMESQFGKEVVEHPRFHGFDLEDFIYLIGPITWLSGVIWFFIPYALGTIGYLIWTIIEFYKCNKKRDQSDDRVLQKGKVRHPWHKDFP